MAVNNEGSRNQISTPTIVVPSTPPPQPIQTSNSSEMTPPPSTQPAKPNPSTVRPGSPLPQSPPPTVDLGTSSGLPTVDDINTASMSDLRAVAQDLSTAVAEARMSAAHYKLQHNLLTIESEEATQRAEIEHQMTRREVEVLQATDCPRSSYYANPRGPHGLAQPQIDALKRSCKDLEDQKAILEYRLQKAKKIIEKEMDKAELLYEENLMLKRRIKENREHFTMLRQSPAFSTPRDDFTTPQRKPAQRYPESGCSRGGDRSQDPLAALLAADQVLSGEVASVQSTPSKNYPTTTRQGHTRGAFSLSALQTPSHQRSLTAVGPIHRSKCGFFDRLNPSAPGTQLARPSKERVTHDRDSTISVSDEEALTEDDLPQSQASSLATSMLRRHPGNLDGSKTPGKVEKSSKALQTTLFGPVKKAGIDRKRHASFGDNEFAKRTNLGERIGLGIKAWGTSKA